MHGVFYFIIYVLVRIFIQEMKLNTFLNFYRNNDHAALYDIGFKYIPRINIHFLDDIMVILPIILCIYLRVNFSEFLFLLTCIYILREITTTITFLPPTPFCFDRVKDKMDKSEFMTKISGTCNETIFSGHTSLMLLGILFILPKVNNNILKILLYFYAIITSLIIIALRAHYTIDIVLAWIICIMFYCAYFGSKIVKKLIIN